MFLLKAENLTMETGGKVLFENVSLEIEDNERIALIGENGIGKTTLIKGLLGLYSPILGNIHYGIEKNKIGYMVQESLAELNLTVRNIVESDHPNSLIKLELKRYENLLNQLPDIQEFISKYNDLLQVYLDGNGYEWELNVEKILKQVGINEDLWDAPFSNLSGGQKTRVKLAKIMLQSPKLIVLDEPTNHLDIESIQWLEDWLKQFNGSILFISHEREFIDHVATSTIELTKKGVKKYVGGYSSFKQQKDHELKTLQNIYEKQEQERKKLIETITQYKQWYDKANSSASVRDPYAQKKAAKQATKLKAKEKALERIDQNKIDKPEDIKSISANLISSDFSGRKMLEMSNISFSYGNKPIFRNIDLQINREDRLAVVGPNGSGKTTLLKLMTGVIEQDSGIIVRNPQLKIGHFFQELENLDYKNTILEEILSIPNMTQSDARTILACFLFPKEDVYKTIGNLSMGEKCRVAFVKLYFSDANLLVLDEPTNYFDIPTRETIENALLQYPGAIVIVAHDPYLLRKIANNVVYIADGNLNYFPGSYSEWENYEKIPSHIQQLNNELNILQLEYLQLVTEDPSDKADEERRLTKIKELKTQIEGIQKKMNMN